MYLHKRDSDELTLDDLWGYKRTELNQAMSGAIGRAVAARLDTLPTSDYELSTQSPAYRELVDELRSLDVAEMIGGLEVSGDLSRLPFEFSEAELKSFLLANLPPLAIKQVKKIEFRPLTQEEDAEDNNLGLNTSSDELGGSIIVISDKKVHEFYDLTRLMFAHKGEFADEMAGYEAKARMMQTVIHEFAHALHLVLPVAALNRWDETTKGDRTNVTGYVKYMNDNKHPYRYMEDFADSMALFIGQPAVLKIISPSRFDAMCELFEEFSPRFDTLTRPLLDRRIAIAKASRLSMGLTDEEVKRVYLAHEEGQAIAE